MLAFDHGLELLDLLARKRGEKLLSTSLGTVGFVAPRTCPRLESLSVSAPSPKRAIVTTHSRVGTLDHTSQKGRLVREILDSQRPETRDTLASSSHGAGASASRRLAHHLGVHARQTERCDIRYDDKGSGEDTLVSRFGSLDNLSPKDDIETGAKVSAGAAVEISRRLYLRGIEPVGISFAFSWMRTFCQSENLDCSMLSCQAVRFEHVRFGQMVGWDHSSLDPDSSTDKRE
jgi:hypothetical protein